MCVRSNVTVRHLGEHTLFLSATLPKSTFFASNAPRHATVAGRLELVAVADDYEQEISRSHDFLRYIRHLIPDNPIDLNRLVSVLTLNSSMS